MKSIYDASVKELKHLTDLLKSRLSRGSITPTEYEQLEYAEAKVLTN